MPGTIADDEPQARIFRLQLGKLRGLAHSGATLRIWRDRVLQNLDGVSVRLLDEVPMAHNTAMPITPKIVAAANRKFLTAFSICDG